MIQQIPFNRGGIDYVAHFGKDEKGYLIKIEQITPDELGFTCVYYFSFLQTVSDNEGYIQPFNTKFRKEYWNAGKAIPPSLIAFENPGAITNLPDFNDFMDVLFSQFAPSVINLFIRAILDFDEQSLIVLNTDGTVTINTEDNGTPAVPGAYESHFIDNATGS